MFDYWNKRSGFYDGSGLEGCFTDSDRHTAKRSKRSSMARTNSPRRNMAAMLNGEIRKSITVGETDITAIRDKYAYPGGRRSPERHNREHERFAKSAKSVNEGFNRLHPNSRLGRSGGDFDHSGGVFERLGRSYGDGQQRDGKWDTGPRGNFDFRPDDPGRRRNSEFDGWDAFAPELRAERVRDARGSIDGDNENGRHWPRGEPEVIVAQWLLAEARRLLEGARTRSYGQGYPK